MQVYKDQDENIYTDPDYSKEVRSLKAVLWSQEKEVFHVDHEDFVAAVPGSMTLAELDENLEQFNMFANICAPYDYSISKILAEYQDSLLLKKVLGLNLIHLDESTTKAGSKVIKDVSGYDMKKLYIGSFNSLALIASAFIRLEKRFENQLVFEFKLEKNLKKLLKLRNFLQSFLDNRIVFKASYNKASDDFSIVIKTSEQDKILDYRKKAIANFLKNDLGIDCMPNKQNFLCDYKQVKRIEVDFDFSKLENILSKINEDILIEPLLGSITMNDYRDLNSVLSDVSNVKVFPVTLFNRKLARTLACDGEKIVSKLKSLYDSGLKLNPGVL